MEFDASGGEELLKVCQVGRGVPDGSGDDIFLPGVGYQHAHRFADVPLHGVEAVTAIGDVV